MTDLAAGKPVAAQAAATASKPRAGAKPRELRDIDFSKLRLELENIRSSSGESLYNHLKKLFEHMILHNPEQALERFEEVSFMIKQGRDPNEFITCDDFHDYREVSKDQEEYVTSTKPLFAQGEPDEDGNIAQPDPLVTQVQDLMEETRIYQWAGIGFGEQETYRL